IETLVYDIVDPMAGDYNWDHVVDQDDYVVWKSRYGSTLHLNTDGNRDGVIDARDFVIWRNRLGNQGVAVAVAAEGAAAVDEAFAPSSHEAAPSVAPPSAVPLTPSTRGSFPGWSIPARRGAFADEASREGHSS